MTEKWLIFVTASEQNVSNRGTPVHINNLCCCILCAETDARRGVQVAQLSLPNPRNALHYGKQQNFKTVT